MQSDLRELYRQIDKEGTVSQGEDGGLCVHARTFVESEGLKGSVWTNAKENMLSGRVTKIAFLYVSTAAEYEGQRHEE